MAIFIKKALKTTNKLDNFFKNLGFTSNICSFYPTAIEALWVLFSPMVSGWLGWAGWFLAGLFLRNRKV